MNRKFLAVVKTNNSIDCFQVIFIGLFMFDDSYSILIFKLSDYISHSMKHNVCIVYFQVNLRTTRKLRFLYHDALVIFKRR